MIKNIFFKGDNPYMIIEAGGRVRVGGGGGILVTLVFAYSNGYFGIAIVKNHKIIFFLWHDVKVKLDA